MNREELKVFLDEKYLQYHSPEFIENDPISIPHQFSKKEDIEISGLLTALISWGKRELIMRSANEMMKRMNNQPFDFVMRANPDSLDAFDGFVYRTFNAVDARSLVLGLKNIYQNHGGMENAFSEGITSGSRNVKEAILHFRQLLVAYPGFEQRSHKHVANPAKKSSSKRLNMFLRWMVRSEKGGVDFGLWKSILPAQLICPLDVHTGNVSRKLGLLTRKQNDWQAAEMLTENLAKFDPQDPVKYDFSLFGLGIYDKF